MRFYASERLGPSQSLTREGYLIVEGAPIARTGVQIYGPGEIPIESGPDGRVLIERSEDEVFKPEAIASFEGKPITLDHPPVDVTTDNWRDLACGHAQHIRRGAGALDDMLLGDLVITCPNAIQAVRTRTIRQLSAGYDADYEATGPGKGLQRNILGNHIALVDEARCGPRCSVGDHACDRTKRGTYDASRNYVFRDGKLVNKTKDAKQPKEVVQYTSSAEDKSERCGLCSHFVPPDACELVQGDISSSGWCELFNKSPIRDALHKALRQTARTGKTRHIHLHL